MKRGLKVILILWAFTCEALSCPAYLTRREMRSELLIARRKSIRIFAIQKVNSMPQWREISVQIDPRRRDDFYDLGVPWQTLREGFLGSDDRIAMRIEEFGDAIPSKMKFPCDALRLVELKSKEESNRFAYLASCEDVDRMPFQPKIKYPIDHDVKEHAVRSKDYIYDYLPTNHLMFNKIVLNPDVKPIIASFNSDQRIRANVKSFFTMNFDKDDVESELLDSRSGPLGLVGRLTFYLHVLFFKIDLKLHTGVSFFSDSVDVPMVINLPVDGRKRMHPGSGILFTWETDPTLVTWDLRPEWISPVDPKLILEGFEKLSNLGTKNCHGKVCNYKLRGTVSEHLWELEFVIPKTLVESGFFPMFVGDTKSFLKESKWGGEKDISDRRSGVYLETSGLEKGEHPYQFWIKVAQPNSPIPDRCPRPIEVVGSVQRRS